MVFGALQKVFKNIKFMLLSGIVTIVTFLFVVWLPNFKLLSIVLSDLSISLASKINLLVSLTGSIKTNFTVLSALYTIIIAILFGVYVGMLSYFVKNRIAEVGQRNIASGFFGIVSGIVGAGCAACGSFILTSLTLVGASGVLAYLPLDGGEFSIVGIFLLALAVYLVAKKIMNPRVCSI